MTSRPITGTAMEFDEHGVLGLEAELASTRRQFLAASLAGVAGGAAALGLSGAALAQDKDKPDAEASSDSHIQIPEGAANDTGGELTLEDMEAAERVMDVAYSPERRQQILEYMDRVRGPVAEVRKLDLPNGLPPAPAFDPRLPGKGYGKQTSDVRLGAPKESALPASEADIAYAPLTALAGWIKSGKISSRELTEIYLRRIAQYAEKLNCFVTVTDDLARAEADRADTEIARGNYRGPLHGIPYGLKDLVDTKDIRTTWGAEPYKNRIAQGDATIVTKLRDAGAVLIGKATCGALAYGDVWFGGTTRNPWNTDEGSSGSSAGPASSTAAGLVGFSIGTETLGSIISPANRCGVAGLRPTFGRVSRAGAMALAWSLDKIGPLCRTAEDTALVLAALNGFDAADASSIDIGFHYDGRRSLDGLRVGYLPTAFEGDGVSDTDRAVLQSARDLGFDLKELTLPEMPFGALFPIIRAESAAAFEELTLSGGVDSLRFQGPTARSVSWRAARFLSAVDYVNMERFRRQVMVEMDKLFADVDVIIGPNFTANMLLVTNYTGHPQLAFRAGFHQSPTRIQGQEPEDGAPTFRVPRSFSVYGQLFQDGKVIAVARALENAMGAAAERPALFI